MTARHQLRVGGRRLGRERSAPIDATPAPTLGEMLRVARERKGVDLFRAERDTKIRARHLEALEDDDYSQLPGAVYTKGFLRNYSIYLGLDPDEAIARWREQTKVTRRTETVSVRPPRPLAAPRRGLTFTRGVVVAALVTALFVAFIAFIGAQLVRFSESTPVAVAGERVREIATNAETTVLAGTSIARATVTVQGPNDFLRTTEAGADGRWSLEVPVSRGRNDFSVFANDPETDRRSEVLSIIVTVPVLATPSPGPSPSASAAPAVALTLGAPLEGAQINEAVVTVTGSTDAASVVVSAAAASPSPSATPRLGAPSPTAPPAPEPITVEVVSGTFSVQLTLPAGPWTITTTASTEGRTDAVATRSVTVTLDGISVTVAAQRGNAYLQVSVDGVPYLGWNPGRILRRGEMVTFRADSQVLVRTGNSGSTVFTVNGQLLGTLGDAGQVENWLFERGREPRLLP